MCKPDKLAIDNGNGGRREEIRQATLPIVRVLAENRECYQAYLVCCRAAHAREFKSEWTKLGDALPRPMKKAGIKVTFGTVQRVYFKFWELERAMLSIVDQYVAGQVKSPERRDECLIEAAKKFLKFWKGL